MRPLSRIPLRLIDGIALPQILQSLGQGLPLRGAVDVAGVARDEPGWERFHSVQLAVVREEQWRDAPRTIEA